MNKRIGIYVVQKMTGESFKAYVPPKLPPEPPLDLAKLYPYLEKAMLALAELNSIHKTIPNTALFIHMYVRKEALLSSQIEGTQSSFADLMLFEHHQKPEVALEDVEEVANYVKAIKHGIARLNEDFPLSLRLLKEIHAVLLAGGRGSSKLPGEFRRSQIGSVAQDLAMLCLCLLRWTISMIVLETLKSFSMMKACQFSLKRVWRMFNLKQYILFLDGNGRLGRLLIALLLCANAILDQPILYLSLYLKEIAILIMSFYRKFVSMADGRPGWNFF